MVCFHLADLVDSRFIDVVASCAQRAVGDTFGLGIVGLVLVCSLLRWAVEQAHIQ